MSSSLPSTPPVDHTRQALETPAPPVEQSAEIPVPVLREIGGQTGPEPTRYGDWEKKGRCSDF